MHTNSLTNSQLSGKRIVIAGGTGFIGQAIAAWFGKTNAITILTRQKSAGLKNAGSKPAGPTSIGSTSTGPTSIGPKSAGPTSAGQKNPTSAIAGKNNGYGQSLINAEQGYNVVYRYWDGLRVDPSWAKAIDGADIVINLSGKSVNCRYTPANKQQIFDSRTDSTRAIGLAIRDAVTPPKIWINGSSATIYRDARDRPQDEETGEFHDDFSVRVCQAWEKSFQEQRTPFTRKVALRTAITLGAGGVMIPYLNLLKVGLGGRQGDGGQRYSWVHVHDVCRVIEWIESHPDIEGVYNVSSPNPVTNQEFMATLRQITGHRIGLPAPAWMLKIGARLIGTETELLLKSRWVLPTKLIQSGFQFRYPDLETAIREIIGNIPVKNFHLFPSFVKQNNNHLSTSLVHGASNQL